MNNTGFSQVSMWLASKTDHTRDRLKYLGPLDSYDTQKLYKRLLDSIFSHDTGSYLYTKAVHILMSKATGPKIWKREAFDIIDMMDTGQKISLDIEQHRMDGIAVFSELLYPLSPSGELYYRWSNYLGPRTPDEETALISKGMSLIADIQAIMAASQALENSVGQWEKDGLLEEIAYCCVRIENTLAESEVGDCPKEILGDTLKIIKAGHSRFVLDKNGTEHSGALYDVFRIARDLTDLPSASHAMSHPYLQSVAITIPECERWLISAKEDMLVLSSSLQDMHLMKNMDLLTL